MLCAQTSALLGKMGSTAGKHRGIRSHLSTRRTFDCSGCLLLPRVVVARMRRATTTASELPSKRSCGLDDLIAGGVECDLGWSHEFSCTARQMGTELSDEPSITPRGRTCERLGLTHPSVVAFYIQIV